ncbi:hypothetical protein YASMINEVIRUS_1352 [Yasminevirus sp. GU-2018]|uniref:Uncharacterized protein n=1 Tax=Yasminevirus sp. GU-2018 TaxID=2420051 RepID=A0A5K0UAV0_9VIRU|nr:hypothetical protein YASMINEVIRUS_1352 [Yasminevirus sp. GU-2018]
MYHNQLKYVILKSRGGKDPIHMKLIVRIDNIHIMSKKELENHRVAFDYLNKYVVVAVDAEGKPVRYSDLSESSKQRVITKMRGKVSMEDEVSMMSTKTSRTSKPTKSPVILEPPMTPRKKVTEEQQESMSSIKAQNLRHELVENFEHAEYGNRYDNRHDNRHDNRYGHHDHYDYYDHNDYDYDDIYDELYDEIYGDLYHHYGHHHGHHHDHGSHHDDEFSNTKCNRCNTVEPTKPNVPEPEKKQRPFYCSIPFGPILRRPECAKKSDVM